VTPCRRNSASWSCAYALYHSFAWSKSGNWHIATPVILGSSRLNVKRVLEVDCMNAVPENEQNSMQSSQTTVSSVVKRRPNRTLTCFRSLVPQKGHVANSSYHHLACHILTAFEILPSRAFVCVPNRNVTKFAQFAITCVIP
jgi:hypothetical protein